MSMAMRENGGRADFVCDTTDSILTVHIRGEIDHHTAAYIRQGVDDRLFEKRPRRLILDLSAVSFMDSSGLGLIMGRYAVMRELNGETIVYNPGREVRAVMALAGLERMVKVEFSDRTANGQDHPAGNPTRPTGKRSRKPGTGRRPRRHPDLSPEAVSVVGVGAVSGTGQRDSGREAHSMERREKDA